MSVRRATVVEFHKEASGRFHPFSLTVVEDRSDYIYRTFYDVERSRKYGYIYHMSGGGGSGPIEVSGPYFVTGEVEVKETECRLVHSDDRAPWRSKQTKMIRQRNRTRRLRALPRAFSVGPGQDFLYWLQAHAIAGDAVYCSTCRDWLPEDSLCEHVWWCDTNGWWSTPSDRCKCADREACYGLSNGPEPSQTEGR